MDAPEHFANLLFPALGLMAAAVVLAWNFRRRSAAADRRAALRPGDELSEEKRRRRSPQPLDRVQLRLQRLEDDLEMPLREQMQLLDRLIRLGDDEIARLRAGLANSARVAAATTVLHRQPDLIAGPDADGIHPADAPTERHWKKAA